MRRLILAALVVVALLVLADFGAAAATEYQISETVGQDLELSRNPDVRINGFPFLTQALAGEYDSIRIVATGIRVGKLRDVGAEATLREVDASISQLYANKTESIEVDRVVGRVRIRDRDLGRVIGITDLRIGNASEEQTKEALGTTEDTSIRTVARITGTVSPMGQRTEVTVIAILELVGDQMDVTPTDVYLGNAADDDSRAPSPVAAVLRSVFTTRVDPGGLPFSVRPAAVEVEEGSLVIEGVRNHITITGTAVTPQ